MNRKTDDKLSRSVNDWGWGCENPPKFNWFVGISDISLKAAADVSPGFMADAITPLECREYPYKGKAYSGHNFIRKLIVDDLKKRGIKRETVDNFSRLYDSENVAKMLTVMTTAGVEMFLLVDENGNGAIVGPVYLALARKGAIKGKAIDFKNSLMLRLNQYVEQAMGFIFPVRQAYSLCGAYAFAVTSSDALSDVSPTPLEAKDETIMCPFQQRTRSLGPKVLRRGNSCSRELARVLSHQTSQTCAGGRGLLFQDLKSPRISPL